jgi:hypothetical protein
MPVIEIPIPNSTQRTYYHEPNQRLNSIDINRISGAFPQESMLMSILLAIRGMNGTFGGSPQYQPLGFKISTYDTTTITVGEGVLISTDGIYYFEGATLTPTPEAYFGLYELEPVIEYSNDVMKNFLDITPQTFFTQLGPSRKVFKLKLYENYNITPTFPTVTTGRLELIRYKRNASNGSLVQSSNVLGKAIGVTGFGPGDLKYTITPADGVNWLYCNGTNVHSSYTDLIDVLRDCRVNTSTLNILSITNSGGLSRINISPTNLKNIGLFVHPDKRHHCLEITNSSNPIAYPVGTYRIIGADTIGGSWIDIQYAYQGMSATGTCEIRPFSNADTDGGGARTPVLTYIKNHLPLGDPDDINRNLFTYQRSKNARHSHGSVNLTITGNPALTGSITGGSYIQDIIQLAWYGDPLPLGFNRKMATFAYLPVAASGVSPIDFANQGYAIRDGIISSSLGVNAGDLDVGGNTDLAEGVTIDPDNPNTARPDNFTLWFQIKT